MKKIATLFGIIALVLMMTSCGNTPTSVAEKSVKCLQNKDYKGYVDLIYYSEEDEKSPEELEKGKETLVALMEDKAGNEMKKNGGIKSYEAVSEEISEDGKTATVTMKLTYGDGTSKEEAFKLRKNSDDKWRIDVGK